MKNYKHHVQLTHAWSNEISNKSPIKIYQLTVHEAAICIEKTNILVANGFILNKIDCKNVYRKIVFFPSRSRFKVNTTFVIKPDLKAAMLNMWSGDFVKIFRSY